MNADFTSQTRLKELIYILNEACRTYYAEPWISPTMSDKEYDSYLQELRELEEKTGIIFSTSPTQKVGCEHESYKVKHEEPILSLQNTKSINDIIEFLGDDEGVMSWKLDGVSVILYYQDGVLAKALSRGNGQYGKNITKNVVLMNGVPLKIPVLGTFIVRGEGCISIKEFDVIKKTKEGEIYANPRNLASGLINTTTTTSLLLKHMDFIAHSIIVVDTTFLDVLTKSERLLFLEKVGFKVTPSALVYKDTVEECIMIFSKNVETYTYPVDGLVVTVNDLLFSESLGRTKKFPRDSIAFKWPDKVVETVVTGVKWSVSNTGLITPVLEFEPVFLEGTTIKQANLYSLKIFDKLEIGIGDIVRVYKANKIIPQVEENLTRSNTEKYPKECPVCGGLTYIIKTQKTDKLYCRRCKK